MELTYINDNILTDPGKLINKIKVAKREIDSEAVNLYDISKHDVMIASKRPKKAVTRTLRDETGNPKLDTAGNKMTKTDYEEVTRIPLPIQKFIVEQRMNMLLADPMEIDAAAVTDIEKSLLKVLTTAWQNNKIDYQLQELLIRQMSETEVALIIYKEEAEEGYWAGTANDGKKEKIRINILTSNCGNSLFPVYDKFGDMVAFGRSYKLKDDETDLENEHFDFYTADTNYYYRAAAAAGWELITSTKNIDNKIPIVYFPQDEVEWKDVQPMIGRRETLSSNHGDTNDYSGSPITLITAESVESMPEKDDQGKTIQLQGPGADARYLESKGAPESIKMEYDNLKENTYMFSGTIDYNSLQNFFGSAPSGYAIKLLFQNAHMKAAQKEADFGKGVQRLLNLMKSLLCAINTDLIKAKNMKIKPVFTYYLPKNDTEDLNNLIAAKAAGLISDETAVMKCSLTKDGAAEWEKIKKQKEANPILPPGANAADNLKVA